MNRPQPQITQYFNRLWEVFLPHFNPLWELRACRRHLVGSPPAQEAKGYLVQTCFFHVPATAEGIGKDCPLHLSGLGSPLRLPSNALLAADVSHCPLTKQVSTLAPICSPRWPGPACQLTHRHQTISSAEDLATSQVSGHKLCSHLPDPEPSELVQVLAKTSFTCFFRSP